MEIKVKSFIYHIQINVSDTKKSFPFYTELLEHLDYEVTYDGKKVLGLSNGTTDVWLIQTTKPYLPIGFHRKNIGLNHVAFGVTSKEDVDKFAKDFLKTKKIKVLYDSPREFPEYEKDYYAVYFEDPDRVKLEVVYKPDLENRI